MDEEERREHRHELLTTALAPSRWSGWRGACCSAAAIRATRSASGATRPGHGWRCGSATFTCRAACTLTRPRTRSQGMHSSRCRRRSGRCGLPPLLGHGRGPKTHTGQLGAGSTRLLVRVLVTVCVTTQKRTHKNIRNNDKKQNSLLVGEKGQRFPEHKLCCEPA